MFILCHHIVLFPGVQNYIPFNLFIFHPLKANSNLENRDCSVSKTRRLVKTNLVVDSAREL